MPKIVWVALITALSSCSVYESERHDAALRSFPAVQQGQDDPVWCWAACSAMIQDYLYRTADPATLSADKERPKPETQEQIAERVHGYHEEGDLKVAMATRYEIYRALCPDLPILPFEEVWEVIAPQLKEKIEHGERIKNLRVSGRVSEDHALRLAIDELYPTSTVPLDDLLQGRPAVAALRDDRDQPEGHAYVMTGVNYSKMAKPYSFAPSVADWFVSSDSTNAMRQFSTIGKSVVDVSFRLVPVGQLVHSVTMIDPNRADDKSTSENEMQVRMAFEDFRQRVDFVITQIEARERLNSWSKLVEARIKTKEGGR